MSYRFWLIVVIVAALALGILIPAVKHLVQNRDFRRQVEGNRPMRTAPKETRRTMEQAPNTEVDIALAVAKARRTQDCMGPK